MNKNSKFSLQNSLYKFPYHYLPSLDNNSVFRLHRELVWGLDYMTYISFVKQIIYALKPKSLCDVGCGDGRLVHVVGDFVPNTIGIDLSERSIAFARAFNPGKNILCGDVADLSQQYELVTLIEVLEHIPDCQIGNFMANIARLVNKKGHLLVSVPTTNVPLNIKHYRHYTLSSLESTLEPYFNLEKYWWVYRRNILERCIRFMLCNRFYVLNYNPILKLIWQIHKSFNYYANDKSGCHLVCLANPKQ